MTLNLEITNINPDPFLPSDPLPFDPIHPLPIEPTLIPD
jgi:hypothetical protein